MLVHDVFRPHLINMAVAWRSNDERTLQGHSDCCSIDCCNKGMMGICLLQTSSMQTLGPAIAESCTHQHLPRALHDIRRYIIVPEVVHPEPPLERAVVAAPAPHAPAPLLMDELRHKLCFSFRSLAEYAAGEAARGHRIKSKVKLLLHQH